MYVYIYLNISHVLEFGILNRVRVLTSKYLKHLSLAINRSIKTKV